MILEAVRPYYGFQGRYWKAGETVEVQAGSPYPASCFRIVKPEDPEIEAPKPQGQPAVAVPDPAATKKAKGAKKPS